MTVKEFFKSKSLKCILALLCVLLVCGIFLTIMNGLLAVTDQERFDRAINKIYGKPVTTEELAVADFNSNATIESAYRIKDDGNYLIKSTGKGGFAGTVTCWVVVEVTNGKVSGIMKVTVDSYVGETQMAEIKDSFLNKFSTGYEEGIIYSTSDGFLVTGSTRSSNAICNAVNGALDYVNALFGNVKAEGEKFLADIQKMYGNIEISVYGSDENGQETLITAETETVKGLLNAPVTVGSSTVSEIYKVKFTDGENEVLHYLVTSMGTGGYQQGTVTCRVAVVIENGAPSTVFNVTAIDNDKQSFLGDVNHYDKYEGVDITGDGFAFTTDDGFVTSGATMSSTAINNAVNGAVNYLKTLNFSEPDNGGEIPDDAEEGGEENE